MKVEIIKVNKIKNKDVIPAFEVEVMINNILYQPINMFCWGRRFLTGEKTIGNEEYAEFIRRIEAEFNEYMRLFLLFQR